MSFSDCKKLYQEMCEQMNEDPQCERFSTWLACIIFEKGLNHKNQDVLSRKLRYYRQRLAGGQVEVRSRALGRPLTPEDVQAMERELNKLRADNYLINARGYHVCQLIRSYNHLKTIHGSYTIPSYILPQSVYDEYNRLVQHA
jgi:hypothetical protein